MFCPASKALPQDVQDSDFLATAEGDEGSVAGLCLGAGLGSSNPFSKASKSSSVSEALALEIAASLRCAGRSASL
eukprot:Skav210889  [mRNA]  locus=scaffold3713:140403:143749:- [translate_table: standard]